MALSRITANSIADGTVVAADIANGSITGPKLGATSINANNIVDSSITSAKIVSVANTQITGNITSSQIVPDPVFNGNTTVTNIIVGAGSNTAPSISSIGVANTGMFFPAANNIGFATNGVTRGTWTNDGLCFNADTAAANALDDYEEGTWTPALQFTGASAGMTYNQQLGTYTKIGRIVHCCGKIELTNKGSSTGPATLAGLPFTVSNVNGNFGPCSLGFIDGATANFGNQMQIWIADPNSTSIQIRYVNGSGNFQQHDNTGFNNGTNLVVSLTYIV